MLTLLQMNRALLFWLVCIPTRVAIAAYSGQAMRYVAAAVGLRWLLGFEDGDVGFFGGRAWWKEERVLHGVLWGAYALTGKNRYLWLDVQLGALNWVIQ